MLISKIPFYRHGVNQNWNMWLIISGQLCSKRHYELMTFVSLVVFQAVDQEANSLQEMLESVVGMIWESGLSYKKAP